VRGTVGGALSGNIVAPGASGVEEFDTGAVPLLSDDAVLFLAAAAAAADADAAAAISSWRPSSATPSPVLVRSACVATLLGTSIWYSGLVDAMADVETATSSLGKMQPAMKVSENMSSVMRKMPGERDKWPLRR